jgi:hypothetical protein
VCTNLIDNAIDAMAGDGTLRLSTRAEANDVIIEVVRFNSLARLIDLICAAQLMSIEGTQAAPNGGTLRSCTPCVDHAR